ncbi:M17 family peptidase N-terminal domain-containing protein [Sphingomonas sp. 22176]|uniref:M17 family peptidase N-terminal domain-containing protein n=1 Tax=Sphingomonas sp. 22176 TaxID=3453884 RepID=UPI003F85C50B
MTAILLATNDALLVGAYRDLQIAVGPRDSVTADVEVAVVGMFTRELAEGPIGGLLHLDRTMGNATTRLRRDGIFRAAPGELLALSPIAPPIKASTILLVGLGDPVHWTPAILGIALQSAARDVRRRGASSASFAPSLLDSGIEVNDPDMVAEQMLEGLFQCATVQPKAEATLWLFCADSAHLTATHAALSRTFVKYAAR